VFASVVPALTPPVAVAVVPLTPPVPPAPPVVWVLPAVVPVLAPEL
jgi:hypothetical protein